MLSFFVRVEPKDRLVTDVHFNATLIVAAACNPDIVMQGSEFHVEAVEHQKVPRIASLQLLLSHWRSSQRFLKVVLDILRHAA